MDVAMKRNNGEQGCLVTSPLTVQEVWTHGGCPDGKGAAVVAKMYEMQQKKIDEKYQTIKIVNLFHSQETPSALNKKIAVFDFSFSKEVTERLLAEADELIVLDHHQSQEPVLIQFPHNCIYDISRSGVRLAWDFFFPGKEVPVWVNYIEDRDLWNWKYPESKAFGAYFRFCRPRCNVEEMAVMLSTEIDGMCSKIDEMPHIIEEGTLYLRGEEELVEMQSKGMIRSYFGGVRAGVGNCSVLHSDTCDHFLKNNPDYMLAIIYHFDSHTKLWKFSLRARKGETDCIPFAQKFGGGGHSPAAGFTLPASQSPTKFLTLNMMHLLKESVECE